MDNMEKGPRRLGEWHHPRFKVWTISFAIIVFNDTFRTNL